MIFHLYICKYVYIYILILKGEGGNETQHHTLVRKMHVVACTVERYMSPQTHITTIDVGLRVFLKYKFIYFNYIYIFKKIWLCYCLQRSHIHFYHSTIFHTFNHTRIFSHCDSGWSDSHPEHLCWNEVEAIFLDGLFFLFEKYLESQISASMTPSSWD